MPSTMINKRVVREMAAGGLTGLAVVLAFILIRGHLDGAKSGDWLQFAGAMLGSGTAVAGALFIERQKRQQDDQRGSATLLDALHETADAFRAAGEPLEGDLSAKVSAINARRYRLEVARDFTDFVLKQHLLPNSAVWRSSHGTRHYIARILNVTWYNYDEAAREDLCDNETVGHWHREVGKIVAAILPIVEGEIASMNRAPA